MMRERLKDQMCRNNFDWLDRSSPPSPPTSHADTSTFSEDADMSEISIPQSPPLPPRPKPKKGVCLGIVNCKVEFPFPPYSSQVSMMSRILVALKRRQHALLESPTGSGKSLALLCSSLAWLRMETARVEEFNRAVEQMIVLGGGRDTVIYDGGDSTRDETQINLSRLPSMSQAGGFVPDSAKVSSSSTSGNVEHGHSENQTNFQAPLNCGATAASTGEPCHDLKPTDQTIELNHSLANVTNSTLPLLKPGQTPRMQRVPRIYYGTRTHKQITQIVKELDRTEYRTVKMTILASREHSCIHPQLVGQPGKNEKCKDLLAQDSGVGCKFYTQKDRLRRAYLPFDGAWDLEDIVNLGDRRAACPYFGTRDLREDAEIVFCPYNYLIDPIIRKSMEIDLRGQVIILDEAHNLEDNARDAVSAIFLSNEIAMLRDDLDRMSKGNLEPVGHDLLARYFTALLQWMEGASVSRESFSGSFDKTANTVTGHCWLQEVETRAQITRQAHAEAKVTYGRCVEAARAADEALAEVQGSRGAPWQRRSKKRGGARTGGTGMVAADGGARLHPLALGLLEKWFLVLDLMVAGGRPVEEDYAVAVTERELNRNELNKIYNSWGGHPANPTGNRTRKLYLWCLNPGLAFFPIVKSARDVILTSGTLTPMDTFSSELGVEFNQQLSAKHVIGQDQVFVDCVSRGPSRNLLLTYQQQSKPEVLVELAELVFDVSLRTPKGILVFFPSYGMMNSTMSYWGETLRSESGLTYMEEIFSVKKVLSEPRDGSQLVDTMDEYRAIIRSSPVLTFEQQTQKRQVTGAILMAVFRGKISEGIDFADDDARAVITFGVPYPSTYDLCVKSKMRYNDRFQSSDRRLLSGRRWYDIQAFRALNQALGRCIRHKNDWGALIVVDSRFKQASYVQSLPLWVRTRIRNIPSYQQQMEELTKFVTERLAADAALQEERDAMEVEEEIERKAETTQLVGDPLTLPSQFNPRMASTQMDSTQMASTLTLPSQFNPPMASTQMSQAWPLDGMGIGPSFEAPIKQEALPQTGEVKQDQLLDKQEEQETEEDAPLSPTLLVAMPRAARRGGSSFPADDEDDFVVPLQGSMTRKRRKFKEPLTQKPRQILAKMSDESD